MPIDDDTKNAVAVFSAALKTLLKEMATNPKHWANLGLLSITCGLAEALFLGEDVGIKKEDINSEWLKAQSNELLQQFLEMVRGISPVPSSPRERLIAVAQMLWKSLPKNHNNDALHRQSMYSFLKWHDLDCFGLAVCTLVGTHWFGPSPVRMQLSEDHCWLGWREEGGEFTTADVASCNKKDVGNPVGDSSSWLYLGGSHIKCETLLMTAATVLQNMCTEIGRKTSNWSSVNCNSGSRGSVGLQVIQQQTLEYLDLNWGTEMTPGAVCALAGLVDAEMYRPIESLFAPPPRPVAVDEAVFASTAAKSLLYRAIDQAQTRGHKMLYPYQCLAEYHGRLANAFALVGRRNSDASWLEKALRAGLAALHGMVCLFDVCSTCYKPACANDFKSLCDVTKDAIETARDVAALLVKYQQFLTQQESKETDAASAQESKSDSPVHHEQAAWSLFLLLLDRVCLWEEGGLQVLQNEFVKVTLATMKLFSPEVRRSSRDSFPSLSSFSLGETGSAFATLRERDALVLLVHSPPKSKKIGQLWRDHVLEKQPFPRAVVSLTLESGTGATAAETPAVDKTNKRQRR